MSPELSQPDERSLSFGFAVPTYGEYADPDRILRLVQAAEELGFDDIWVGDRLAVPTYALPFSDPNWFEALATAFVALGATKRLKIGTDVLVLPLREPITLARSIATVDLLSKQRFILGVGVGYLKGEFEALGVSYDDRGVRTDEYLEILDSLFQADNPVAHDGPLRSFDDVHAGPRPAGGVLPVWVGGNHHLALDRVARFGAGWHPLFPEVDEYGKSRARIEELRSAAGRNDPFVWSYSCPETKVLEKPATVHHSYTHDDVGELPSDFTYAPPVPTTADGRPRFIGTPEQLADDIATFAAAGVRHFTLRFWTGSAGFSVEAFEEQLEAFTNEVVPLCRSAVEGRR